MMSNISFGKNGVNGPNYVIPSSVATIKYPENFARAVALTEVESGDIIKIRPKGMDSLEQVVLVEHGYYKVDNIGHIDILENGMKPSSIWDNNSEHVDLEKIGHIEFRA